MRSLLLKNFEMELIDDILEMQLRESLKKSLGLSCSSMVSKLESER